MGKAIALLPLFVAIAAAEPPGRSIDRAAASRMAALGDRAAKDGQHATARRIFLRAIELDTNQYIARSRLGYRRFGAGEWKLAAKPPEAEDESPAAAARFLKELRAEEERRASAYVHAELTEFYPELLARLPHNEEIHKALGHEKIGNRYVRPELAVAARRFDEQQAHWRKLAAPVAIEPDGMANIPGVGTQPAYRVEGRRISGTLPGGAVRTVATTLPAAYALMQAVFGNDVRTWEAPLLLFVTHEEYRRCVMITHPPGNERDRWLRSGLMQTPDFTVFDARDALKARDAHAHTVGIYSAGGWCVPKIGEEWDHRAYNWFREGLGYFASMTLFKTGMTSFHTEASSMKIPNGGEPPEQLDRNALLPWLQQRMQDGTTERLHDVFGRGINNLDLLLSLEAWSFLEFLAAYDPEGLRRLPGALKAEVEGPYPDRANRALQAAFGKDLAELEPLWREFVLEVM